MRVFSSLPVRAENGRPRLTVSHAGPKVLVLLSAALVAAGVSGCNAAEDASLGTELAESPRIPRETGDAAASGADALRSHAEADVAPGEDGVAPTARDASPPVVGADDQASSADGDAPPEPEGSMDVPPDAGVPSTPDAGDLDAAADEQTAMDADVGLGFGPAPVVINEVESSGGVPGDWLELYNTGTAEVDVSGWAVEDSDDAHVYRIPAGSRIGGGAYLVLEESVLGFGLGSADSARLFDAAGGLVASYSWSEHAYTTYGRCGGAELVTTAVATKGAANVCTLPELDAALTTDAGEDAGPVYGPWPGGSEVIPVDPAGAYAGNLSALAYQAGTGAPDTLWAVQNDPATLYALHPSTGGLWIAEATDGANAGRGLRYPDGSGAPDAEGVTVAELDAPFVYVAAERDNLRNTVSRQSVLRYDARAAGAELVATHEWNLTADLPPAGPNEGLEAIAWIPDGDLTTTGFLDERTNQPYAPALYPNHGSGIFFVGSEASGTIYGYALDHATGAAYRVATIASGQPAIMDLAFDRDLGRLWAYCDDTCGNRATVLEVAQGAGVVAAARGRFALRDAFAPPSTMPNLNNEGIAIAPNVTCEGGVKAFFWADDGATSGHSLRRGTIACSSLP